MVDCSLLIDICRCTLCIEDTLPTALMHRHGMGVVLTMGEWRVFIKMVE
jgi:hypothetical protein